MPVVIITAPALADDEAEAPALVSLASAIAGALGLSPSDVVTSLVHVARATDGTGAIPAWPTVVLHGSRRTSSRMSAAEDAARASVAVHWDTPPEQVWTQWSVRES